eukprot:228218-Prymnesium_polylepis.1
MAFRESHPMPESPLRAVGWCMNTRMNTTRPDPALHSKLEYTSKRDCACVLVTSSSPHRCPHGASAISQKVVCGLHCGVFARSGSVK